MFVITYSKILKNVQIRSVAVDKYFRKQSSTESLKQSSSDSKKKDLTIANQMQNGVNSNSRERETNNFEDEFPRTSNCAIIFDVLGSYLEEAKPILGGAEIADYVAEV